ncbi:MAG: 2OG-Fe(II) oxygenase [Acidobacteria bacterium]|nr:2OG-Fe(II) oxygenase [Acidobacteriota bacterium]
MTEVELGGQKSFIGAWYLEDIDVCDELVAYFNDSPTKVDGQFFDGRVDKEVKDSVDLQITPDRFTDPPVFRYLDHLRRVCNKYVEKYQGSAALDGWGIAENVNIQHYAPGGGYKVWHCERWGTSVPCGARHLVFMTYLNDVSDAGGTEFLYQLVTVQPRKGLTLIWPADWTHHHRGIVSPTEEKYIITGWFSFM